MEPIQIFLTVLGLGIAFIITSGVIMSDNIFKSTKKTKDKNPTEAAKQRLAALTKSIEFADSLSLVDNKAEIKRAENLVKENSDPIHILFEISNSELRQTMIAKYGGFEALLSKCKHDILHTDDYGVLFRVWVANTGRFYYYVKVINGTQEDDGSFREYYKEVPPDMDTAKEAVAWTYGLHPDDYDIAIRT